MEGLGWEHRDLKTSRSVQLNGHQIPYSVLAEINTIPILKFDQKAFKTDYKKDPKKFHKKLKNKYHKHLLLFSDNASFFTLSYLSTKEQVRPHNYFKGQNEDYFIQKLTGIHFGIEDNLQITDIGKRLEKAFDTEKVTKKFYEDFKDNHLNFQKYISGIKSEEDKKWYASLILNRLMFIWFLQKKYFVNNDFYYLQTKLKESKKRGKDKYYSEFLTLLFFEGFAKKPIERSGKAKELLGQIKYLNGGLFIPHAIEEKYKIKTKDGLYKTKIKIQDKAFEETFQIFGQYEWPLEGRQGKSDNEISPDVMGYIFEKYINELQKKSRGAYYTRDEITQYLAQNTIQKTILEKVNKKTEYNFENIASMLHRLDASLCKILLTDEDSILNTLTVLDPAVGSGAFLTAAIKELLNIYSPIIGKIETLADRDLKKWLEDFKNEHKSLAYGIKKNIILKNLYGVDIMKEAVEVCKLRLFLSLVSSALEKDELEPLPNMDFNIMCGNSLIGFLREHDEDTQDSEKQSMDSRVRGNNNPQGKNKLHKQDNQRQMAWSEVLGESYEQIKDKYNQMVNQYKNQPMSFKKLKDRKNKTTRFLEDNNNKLNRILADKCNQKGLKYSKVTDIQGKQKSIKHRSVKPSDFCSTTTDEKNLNPFHWDLAFNEIMNRGGFDVIITNPPWEKVEIEDKEFFHKYDTSINKKKTKKEAVKEKKEKLLQQPLIKKNYLKTKEFYLFQRSYFLNFYKYQRGEIFIPNGESCISPVTNMDTYRLFLERCFELLNKEGFLGIVLPSGLHKDDGAIGLRKNLLFKKTKIAGFIDFQNQMEKDKGRIFEGVHPSFKFLLLNLQKTEPKNEFPCRFHTRNLMVLEHFPNKTKENFTTQKKKNTLTITTKDKEIQVLEKNATTQESFDSETVWYSLKEIKKLSPRDHSIIELKNPMDKKILNKVNCFPTMGENLKNLWNPYIYTAEFNETHHSDLFKSNKNSNYELTVYPGKAIYQYEFNYAISHINRYVSVQIPKVIKEQGFPFKKKCYKDYRLVIRTIARNTDERSLIAAVIPKNHFISNSLYGVHIESPIGASSPKKDLHIDLKTHGKKRLDSHVHRNDFTFGNTVSYGKNNINGKNKLWENNKKLQGLQSEGNNNQYMLVLQAFLNSFVVDYLIRQKVSANINKKYIISLHIPRLNEKNLYFKELVKRSALLTCIGREFNALADETGIPRGGVKDKQHRWRIQSEIDAIVAHTYDLTLEEFEYILSTFTTGNNQERLKSLKKYALSAFKKGKFVKKAS